MQCGHSILLLNAVRLSGSEQKDDILKKIKCPAETCENMQNLDLKGTLNAMRANLQYFGVIIPKIDIEANHQKICCYIHPEEQLITKCQKDQMCLCTDCIIDHPNDHGKGDLIKFGAK